MTPNDLTCTECRERLPWYMAGSFSDGDWSAMNRHLAGCVDCHREEATWDAIAAALDDEDRRIPDDTHAAEGWEQLQLQLGTPHEDRTGRQPQKLPLREDQRADFERDIELPPWLRRSAEELHAQRDPQHPLQAVPILARPHQRLKRQLGALGAVAAVLLLLVGFAVVLNRNSGSGSPAPTPPALTQPALTQPAPTQLAPTPPGPTPQVINDGSLIAVVSNLSFGSVTIDGKTEVGKPPFFINLPSGEVTVTYAAPPFRTQSCIVSWAVPNSHPPLNVRGAGCNSATMIPAVQGAVNGQALYTSTGLSFQFDLRDLPSTLQATALDLLHQVVTPVSLSQMVPPGQYYATGRDGQGMILSRQATTSLTAQVSLVLPTPQDLISPLSMCPVVLCAPPFAPLDQNAQSVVAGKLWQVMVPLAMDWRFSLPDGQLVGSEHVGVLSSALTLTLVLDSQQQWHLAQPTNLFDEQLIPQTFCGVEESELQSALAYHHAGNHYSFNTSGLGVPAGCEIQITQDSGPLIGPVVWRFGVLLAAAAQTQSAFPWLPLAPQAEVNAVNGG